MTSKYRDSEKRADGSYWCVQLHAAQNRPFAESSRLQSGVELKAEMLSWCLHTLMTDDVNNMQYLSNADISEMFFMSKKHFLYTA